MVAWVEQLARLGIVARVMISENQLVTAEDRIKVVVDDGRAHIRWPGGAATVAWADLPLTVSLVDNTLPIEICIDAARTADMDLQINELRASERDVNITPIDVSVFQYLCSQIQPDQINLLQGEFKVEEKRTGQQIVWRSVAVLVVCAVLLHMATLIGQGWYLASKAQAFESRTMALYKEVFPTDRNVRDVRRRWNSHLGKSGADVSQFLSLFAQSSRGLPAAGLTLTNVNFNESRGDLILQVSGKRSEELVQYAQRLSSQGIDAEIGTISQEDDTVRGSIKVRAGGGAS
jgi:type II secretion system protein L